MSFASTVQSIVTGIEGFLSTVKTDIKSIFAKAEAEEDTLIPEVEAILTTIKSYIDNPEAITIANVLGVSPLLSLGDEVIADIFAACTWLQGLTKVAVTADQPAVLANPDAVLKASVQIAAQGTSDQQEMWLQNIGNMLVQKASPVGANISYGEANLTRAIYKITA